MKYIGIDIAKETNHACIMNHKGEVLDRPKVANSAESMRMFLKSARRQYGKFVVGCEATGYMWVKLCDVCQKENIEFKLGSAYKMRIVWMTSNKNDAVDAEKIADLLRRNAFPACYIGSRETRALRDLMRCLISLIQDRTRVCNRLRAMLVKYDLRLNASKIYSNKALDQLKNLTLNNHVDNTNIRRYIRQLEYYNREIYQTERDVLREAANSKYAPYVRLLVSLPGVDVYTAMLLSAEIDEIGRFSTPRKLISMMGMCPTVYQSGDSLRHGGMKKFDVNRRLNWIMIQAASVAVRYDDRLKEYYERVRKRHGDKHGIAITHVANKMVRFAWAMLVNDEPYRHRNEKRYQEKLAKLDRAMHSNSV